MGRVPVIFTKMCVEFTVSVNKLFSFAEPCDNMREILQNVAKLQGVSNMRKLGHLNNFTKVRAKVVQYTQNILYVLYQTEAY